MILHNLTRIRNKSLPGQAAGGSTDPNTSSIQGGALSGGNSVNSNIDGGASHEGGTGDLLEKELTMYATKLTTRGAGEPMTLGPRGKPQEVSLALEHKIFFNEYYRNEYERNKLIIAKNDKRKKGLLQDKGQSTDFERAIVYEAYDTVYKEVLPMSDHQNGAVQSQMVLTLLMGRMSGHKVLRLELHSLRQYPSGQGPVSAYDLHQGIATIAKSVGTPPEQLNMSATLSSNSASLNNSVVVSHVGG